MPGHKLYRETKQIESYRCINQLNFTKFYAEEVDCHISKKDQLFDRNKVSELFRKPLKNCYRLDENQREYASQSFDQ